MRRGLPKQAPTGEDLLEQGDDRLWFRRFLLFGPGIDRFAALTYEDAGVDP